MGVKNNCEHEDFSIGVTVLERDLYEDDRLVIAKIKCDDCGKDGIIAEMHYNNSSSEDHWIHGETNFNVKIEDEAE